MFRKILLFTIVVFGVGCSETPVEKNSVHALSVAHVEKRAALFAQELAISRATGHFKVNGHDRFQIECDVVRFEGEKLFLKFIYPNRVYAYHVTPVVAVSRIDDLALYYSTDEMIYSVRAEKK